MERSILKGIPVKRLLILMLAVVALSAITAQAQTTPNLTDTDTYTVQKDDTLYQLASIYKSDPMKWREVLGANPFLKEPGRIFERDGKTIVVIRPGETLSGLTTLGIEAEVLPIDKLKLPETAAVIESKGNEPASSSEAYNFLMALLLATAVLMAAYLVIRKLNRDNQTRVAREAAEHEHELTQNPVTSGPPIIAGGVRTNEPVRLSQALEAAAITDYVRLNPNVNRNDVRVERIGPVEEGMISGSGMVGYADRARPRTINPALPGYRARFRFPDGREDNLMSLQGCMNPVYFGEGMSGFTFTPGRTVVETPAPVQPGPQALPHPAMAIARIRAAAEGEGASTMLIGGEIVTIARGAHFDLDSTPGSVKVTGGAFETTFRLKPVRKAIKAPAVPKTGTTD